MADQPGVPESGQDATTAGAPADSGQGFDYQRSYDALLPEFTRKSQALSEYEQVFAALRDPDPDVQAQAMQYLGLELAADTGEPIPASGEEEWVDPLEQKYEELSSTISTLQEQLELERAQQDEEELEQMKNEYIGEAISYIEDSTNRKFSVKAETALGNLALSMSDEQGLPDVQGAYQLLYGDEDSVLESERSRWIESKTGAGAPPSINQIPADKRPRTPAERVNFIDERVRAMGDQY